MLDQPARGGPRAAWGRPQRGPRGERVAINPSRAGHLETRVGCHHAFSRCCLTAASSGLLLGPSSTMVFLGVTRVRAAEITAEDDLILMWYRGPCIAVEETQRSLKRPGAVYRCTSTLFRH